VNKLKILRKRRPDSFYALPDDDSREALPWWLLAVLWGGLFGLYKLTAYLFFS
jgi:hypothetical protein